MSLDIPFDRSMAEIKRMMELYRQSQKDLRAANTRASHFKEAALRALRQYDTTVTQKLAEIQIQAKAAPHDESFRVEHVKVIRWHQFIKDAIVEVERFKVGPYG